jgi:hypothetical protein
VAVVSPTAAEQQKQNDNQYKHWLCSILEHDRDCNRFTGKLPVVQVVAVVEADINVVGGIPILRPIGRPGVHHQEGIAAVLEARIAVHDNGLALKAEPISNAEVEAKTRIFRTFGAD